MAHQSRRHKRADKCPCEWFGKRTLHTGALWGCGPCAGQSTSRRQVRDVSAGTLQQIHDDDGLIGLHSKIPFPHAVAERPDYAAGTALQVSGRQSLGLVRSNPVTALSMAHNPGVC